MFPEGSSLDVSPATAALVYLIISGTILDVLRLVQPLGFNVLVPAATITLASFFLLFYLSPNFHNSIRGFITRNFFRNKYDYRDLWMKFSDKSSGSLNIRELLPKVGDFVAEGDVRSTSGLLASGSDIGNRFIWPIAMTLFMPRRAMSSSLQLDSSRARDTMTKIVRVPARRRRSDRKRHPDRRRESFSKNLGIERLSTSLRRKISCWH